MIPKADCGSFHLKSAPPPPPPPQKKQKSALIIRLGGFRVSGQRGVQFMVWVSGSLGFRFVRLLRAFGFRVLWFRVVASWLEGIYLPIATGSIHLNLSYSTLPKFLGELGQLGRQTVALKYYYY